MPVGITASLRYAVIPGCGGQQAFINIFPLGRKMFIYLRGCVAASELAQYIPLNENSPAMQGCL